MERPCSQGFLSMSLQLAQIGTALFFLAILHIFISPILSQKLLHKKTALKSETPKALQIWQGFLHLLTEVEFILGFWSLIFLLAFISLEALPGFLKYQESLDFTEPFFVFVIMVISASRPVLWFAEKLIEFVSALLAKPFKKYQIPIEFFVILTLGPLAGSFITEPAAMTVSALLLLKVLGRSPEKFSMLSWEFYL